MFIDEWNTLLRIKATFTPTLKFKLFGKQHSITFDDLAAGKLDAYLSVGGECNKYVLYQRILTEQKSKKLPLEKQNTQKNENQRLGFMQSSKRSYAHSPTHPLP